MNSVIKSNTELRKEFARLLQDYRVQIPNRVVGDLLGVSRGHVHNLLNRRKEYRLRASTRLRMSLFNQCIAIAIERSSGGASIDEMREVVRQLLEEHGIEYQIGIDPNDDLLLNFSRLVDSVSESQTKSSRPGNFTIVAPLNTKNLTGKSIKSTAIWFRMMFWLRGIGAEILTSDEFEEKVLIGAHQWPLNVIIIGGDKVDSESHHHINRILEDTGQLVTVTRDAFFRVRKLGEKNYWLLTGEDGDALRQAAEWLLKALLSPTEQQD